MLLPGHASFPFSPGRAKSRYQGTLLNGISRGVLPQAVTTVWRTKLGTTLLNGFNCTTAESAYFHHLCLLQVCNEPPTHTKFLFRMAPPTGHFAYKRAVESGAKSEMAPTDMFWGDRYGKILDPFGHSWAMAT